MEQLYLDLLKKSLLGELYWDNEARLLYLRDCLRGRDEWDPDILLRIGERRERFCREYNELTRTGRFVNDLIENSGYRHTMIGKHRLENVAECLDTIRRTGVPGDLIECGVWRGGAAIFMRGFLKAWRITDRIVWAADSFAGLPPPSLPQDDGNDLSPAKYPMLAVSLTTVREIFARYDLLDAQVRFLEGWFKETLPSAPIERLALLRIDADLYESTRDALSALYPRLSDGGFAIVDDYGCIPACRLAVDEYRREHGIAEPLRTVDWTGVFWQKDATPARSFGMIRRNSSR